MMMKTKEEEEEFKHILRSYDKQFKYNLGILCVLITILIIAYCFDKIEYVFGIPLLVVFFLYNLGYAYYCYRNDIHLFEEEEEKNKKT